MNSAITQSVPLLYKVYLFRGDIISAGESCPRGGRHITLPSSIYESGDKVKDVIRKAAALAEYRAKGPNGTVDPRD